MLNRMHLESPNREAFDLLTDALEFIDRYRRSREVEDLKVAWAKLDSAVSKDPGYIRASYFRAIVDDLDGRSGDAASAFAELLLQRPPFVEEVRYNLGVAEYHQYNHAALDRAITHFSQVMEGSSDPTLRLLSVAGLAQAHAMRMIPKDPREPQRSEMSQHFEAARDFAQKAINAVSKRRGLFRFFQAKIETDALVEVRWAALNAMGMARMYNSDYFPEDGQQDWKEKRIQSLRETLVDLNQADETSSRNWANYCDMASANMRLGFYTRDPSHFRRALDLLDQVIAALRPRYAFARYEKGRVLRLESRFPEAAQMFQEVLDIPAAERDIGDHRLQLELERCGKADVSFP